ncbi:MAG: DUF4145 domain-containing protein [Hydrogenophaga sp.]|nr:DUF4145 domain-containing protein [Hydrogenophaga sp.]
MDEFEKDTRLEPMQLSCIKCTGETRHTVMTSILHRYSEDIGHHSFQANTAHQIAQCNGCLSLTYLSSATNSEDYEHDENNDVYYPAAVKMYPPRTLKPLIDGVDLFAIPNQTRELLTETRGALANEYQVLAGIGLRGLIETVVKAQGSKGRNLQEKIDDLVENRILTPARANILHEIRAIGNVSAHEAKPHTIEQLNLALEAIEHVLQEVYVLPDKAKRVFTKVGVPSPPELPPMPIVPPPPVL